MPYLSAVDWPHTLVLWTIRASLLLYAAALALWILQPTRLQPSRENDRIRLCWTAAWIFYVLHVWAAFHVVHHWDHAHAVAHTAQQTEEVVGIRFGGGIYFNHLLTLLWTMDVVWWWFAPASHAQRPGWIHYALQGYIFFLALNGSVIFESGVARWFGIPIVVLLGIMYLIKVRGPKISKQRKA